MDDKQVMLNSYVNLNLVHVLLIINDYLIVIMVLNQMMLIIMVELQINNQFHYLNIKILLIYHQNDQMNK